MSEVCPFDCQLHYTDAVTGWDCQIGTELKDCSHSGAACGREAHKEAAEKGIEQNRVQTVEAKG